MIRYDFLKNKLKVGFKVVGNSLLNLVFPYRCLVCKAYLTSNESVIDPVIFCRSLFQLSELQCSKEPGFQMSDLQLPDFLPDLQNFDGVKMGLKDYFAPEDSNRKPKKCDLDVLLSQELFQNLTDNFFCIACLEKEFVPFKSPFCSVCGTRFQTLERKGEQEENHMCGNCLSAKSIFGQVRAFGMYETGLKQAVHFLKYRGKTGLASPLGLCLFSAFDRWFKEKNFDMILPIPLHPKKLRSRGFNQAFLLVRDFRRHWIRVHGTPPTWRIDWRCLNRCRNTSSQTGFDQSQRQQNIKGAFMVGRGAKLKGKHILIVDDVFTTGATAREAAQVLLKSGAASVDILVLARA